MDAGDLEALTSDLSGGHLSLSKSSSMRGRDRARQSSSTRRHNSSGRHTSLALNLEPRGPSPTLAEKDDVDSPVVAVSKRTAGGISGGGAVLSPKGAGSGSNSGAEDAGGGLTDNNHSGVSGLGNSPPLATATNGNESGYPNGTILGAHRAGNKRSSSKDSRSSQRLEVFRQGSPIGDRATGSSSALNELYAKYEVYDDVEVGHGAYGVVIKGMDKTTGDYVAIKRISKKRVSSKLLNELQGEVETLSLVANPWTIRLEDFIQDDEHLLIVMDYVPGGNLSDALKKVGKFSEVSVRRFASCLLKAMEYVHGKGIAHRDLKPANCLLAEPIFPPQLPPASANHHYHEGEGDLGGVGQGAGVGSSLEPSGSYSTTNTPQLGASICHSDQIEEASRCLADIKIADFGFATLVGNGQCLTSFCGTTSYMAPEIISRNTNYGKEVDMWSIGVMLFALLCGELPFHGNSGDELAAAVCSGKFEFEGPDWAEVSHSAKSLIKKLLIVNPSKRITAREALQHPWIVSANEEGASAIDYPLGLPRSLSPYFSNKHRPMRPRLRGAIFMVLAAHRLVWYVKLKRLRKEGLDQIPVCKSFSFLVSHTYEPATHSLVAGPMCAANQKAIKYLAGMVDSSRTLETFDVSNTQLDNMDIVQYIVKVSVTHPSLTTLNLEDNPIPPIAGRALLRLARKATGLTNIKCHRTNLGQDVIDQISADLKENERKRTHFDAAASSSQTFANSFGSGNSSFAHAFGSPIGSPSLLPVTSGSFGAPSSSNPTAVISPAMLGLNPGAGGSNQRNLNRSSGGAGGGRSGGTSIGIPLSNSGSSNNSASGTPNRNVSGNQARAYMLPPALHVPFESPNRSTATTTTTSTNINTTSAAGSSSNHRRQGSGDSSHQPHHERRRRGDTTGAAGAVARNLNGILHNSGSTGSRAHSTSPHHLPGGRGTVGGSYTPTAQLMRVGSQSRTGGTGAGQPSNLPPLHHGSPTGSRNRGHF